MSRGGSQSQLLLEMTLQKENFSDAGGWMGELARAPRWLTGSWDGLTMGEVEGCSCSAHTVQIFFMLATTSSLVFALFHRLPIFGG